MDALDPGQFAVLTTSIAKYFMASDMMWSETRHGMVFGQLVMAVQQHCTAAAVPQHSTAQLAKYHLMPWLKWHNSSEGEGVCISVETPIPAQKELNGDPQNQDQHHMPGFHLI